MIKERIFGTTREGASVKEYTITNAGGEYVTLLDYGASVHTLFVKDREGKPGDVVLGVAHAGELGEHTTEGSVMGRVANRIKNGHFVLNGKEVQLECNQMGNCLHSAGGKYALRLFEGSIEGDQTVCFSLLDEGWGGFGNRVDVKIYYTFDDASTLTIRYEMTPLDEATLLAPTNHAYFNLADFTDARAQILQMDAEAYAKKEETGCPNGEAVRVKGTGYDFTSPRIIQDALTQLTQETGKGSLDDYFLLRETAPSAAESALSDGPNELSDGKTGTPCRRVATLYAPNTGRGMDVYTDMPCMIVFTPGFTGRGIGKYGVPYPEFGAVCLETQYVPDAVNHEAFVTPAFAKGETLRTETRYQFYVR